MDDLRHKRVDLKTELKFVNGEHQAALQRIEELQAALKAAEVGSSFGFTLVQGVKVQQSWAVKSDVLCRAQNSCFVETKPFFPRPTIPETGQRSPRRCRMPRCRVKCLLGRILLVSCRFENDSHVDLSRNHAYSLMVITSRRCGFTPTSEGVFGVCIDVVPILKPIPTFDCPV